MIPEIGPTPGQYPTQPHVFGIHRHLYEQLGAQVAQHLRTPVLPRQRQQQVGDVFLQAQQAQAAEPNQQRPEVIARLFKRIYQQLVSSGLLPLRGAEALGASVEAEANEAAIAVNQFSIQSRRYWYAVNGAQRSVNKVQGLAERLEESPDSPRVLEEIGLRIDRPEGMFIIGRSPLASIRSEDKHLSRYHLSGQYRGNLLLLRDGFYPTFDNEDLAPEQAPAWRPTTNGSYYFDDTFNKLRVPSSHAVVLPNRPVYLELLRKLYQLDNGVVTPVTDKATSNRIYSGQLTHRIGDLIQGSAHSITLGREAGFVVNNDRVSRQHAQILHDQGRFSIVDLDSTNGTQVHRTGFDKPIKVDSDRPLRLQPGDVIQLGDSMLTFTPPSLAA